MAAWTTGPSIVSQWGGMDLSFHGLRLAVERISFFVDVSQVNVRIDQLKVRMYSISNLMDDTFDFPCLDGGNDMDVPLLVNDSPHYICRARNGVVKADEHLIMRIYPTTNSYEYG
jgi:hypothetical protein